MKLTNLVFEETVNGDKAKTIVSKQGDGFIFETNGQPTFRGKSDSVFHLVKATIDADQDYPAASKTLRDRFKQQLETTYATLLEMLV